MDFEGSHEKIVKEQSLMEQSQAVKAELRSIPNDQRENYLKGVVATKQLPGPPPFSFNRNYPSTGTFRYREYNLHYEYCQNSLSPKAILFFFHGMGGYSGNTGYLATTICQNIKDINIYTFDQLNFGKSQGPYRGLIYSIEDSIAQGEQFIDIILSKLQSKPKIFLGGGSYGGGMSFKLAVKSPERYAGLVLLGPAIRTCYPNFGKLVCLSKVLGCLFPPFRICKQTGFTKGTRYNNRQALLANEMIYNDGAIPQSGRAVFNTIQDISQRYRELTTPYILFQGAKDKFIDVFAALDLEDESASKDKTTIYFKDMWHSVHAQQQIQIIASECIIWLNNRL